MIDVLRSRARPDLALQSLEATFARTSPDDVPPGDLSRAVEGFGLEEGALRNVLVQLWQKALSAFLADDALSDEEIAYLEALRRVLALSEEEVAAAQAAVVHPRYERELAEVMADQRVSADERERLARLSATLRLAPDVERELHAKAAAPMLKQFVEDAVADRELTADERDTFVELMRHLLGVQIAPGQVTLRTLTRYALLWRLENDALPTIGAPLALERGERCHLYCRAYFSEHVPAADDGEAMPFIRITRGLRYRPGSVVQHSEPGAGGDGFSGGTLYITNKRVVFVGETTTSVPLDAITAIGVRPDALLLETGDGPHPLLVVDDHLELAALILSRVLS